MGNVTTFKIQNFYIKKQQFNLIRVNSYLKTSIYNKLYIILQKSIAVFNSPFSDNNDNLIKHTLITIIESASEFV